MKDNHTGKNKSGFLYVQISIYLGKGGGVGVDSIT